MEYVFRGGFGRVVVFGIPNNPDSYKGDSLLRSAPWLTASSEARQGGDSIEKFWLEFWLEKLLEFWLEIPYTKKMFKN